MIRQPIPALEVIHMANKSKEKTKVLPTLVTFLLDRSSSMGAIWDDTIDGFNAYLDTLKKDGGEAIKFTRLQFDHHHDCQIQKDCVAEPVTKVTPLDKSSYQPRGSTPLIEAATKTIHAVEASLAKFDTKHNVIVCIQTDGQENMSGSEYTWDALKKLIGEKMKAGWVFNFMGTGIDAYAQGSRMGIAASNTMSTGTSREHVTQSYASMAGSNMRFAATADASMSAFTPSERSLSGEKDIMKRHQPSFVAPATPSLDLTAGSGPSKSGGALDLTP
jgi:hypothetical protein